MQHHHYLRQAKYVKEAVLLDHVKIDLGNQVGVIASENDMVKGELYEINPAMLHQLDSLLLVGTVFRKENHKVFVDNKAKEAVVYIYNIKVDNPKRIPYEQE